MPTLLERAEKRRVTTLRTIGHEQLDIHEQFFTPIEVAEIMVSLLIPEPPITNKIRLLDPGAGSGILTAAACQRIRDIAPDVAIDIVAVEKDAAILPELTATLGDVARSLGDITYEVINEDFVTWGTQRDSLLDTAPDVGLFDLVIQNPPYAKLPAKGREAVHLKSVEITVPNIYAAFMAIAVRLLKDEGRLVAITPRSWMNGTYFASFRSALLSSCAIEAIHTFDSRRDVFKDTGVLQESIITVLHRELQTPETVTISSSRSQAHDIAKRSVPYSAVSTNGVVFVPATDHDANAVEWMSNATCSLGDLGIQVSTGRVVDFRSREFLVEEPGSNTVPMIYPSHFKPGEMNHPLKQSKKPQYYSTEDVQTDKNLVPPGTYVVVKRFSAKEEKRRITAAVWQSDDYVAFDNKTNFFHRAGMGLDPELAEGLCRWLNSTQVDDFFRVFSGHTQVNAGDLRMMAYPTADQLKAIAGQPDSYDESVRAVMEEKSKNGNA